MEEGTFEFKIKKDYNYRASTEKNYQSDDHSFYGKYKNERSVLDYTYHRHYTKERQLLQDKLIDQFLTTYVYDKNNGSVCSSPLENWIVFTAGPMGAGKGHTISWLGAQNLFPVSAFVHVDPDRIRALLPEFDGYNEVDDESTGYLTQKEVGYISEIMTYDSLKQGKNVLVDGSLRDAYFYLAYFTDLRKKFPILKVAIINITAKIETVLARAKKRALVTGRTVPESVILEALHKIPESLEILSPIAHFVATFNNDDDSPEPILYVCSMKTSQGQVTWKLFYEFDNSADALLNRTRKMDRCREAEGLPALLGVLHPSDAAATTTATAAAVVAGVGVSATVEEGQGELTATPVSPFTPASPHIVTSASMDGMLPSSVSGSAEPTPMGRSRVDTSEGTIHGVITEGITSNRLSVRKSKNFAAKLRDLIKGVISTEESLAMKDGSPGKDVVKDSRSVTSPQRTSSTSEKAAVVAHSPAATERSQEDSSNTPQTLKSNSNDDAHPGYLYVDYVNDQMQCLSTWKDIFREVWVMYCAPPPLSGTSTLVSEVKNE